MRSPLAVRQGVQTPRVSHAPNVRANSWEDVSDLCSAYGLDLFEWQETVLEGSLGERSDGKWAASQVGVAVPRQNGKGALIEARELAGLLLFGEDLIVHSAHQVQTALEGFRRIRAYFDNYDDLGKLVLRIRESHTEQGIELRSGQRLRFMARSKQSGRGFSAQCLILDEAQELSEDTWAAMQFTISAADNPQVWLLGTPPGPLMNGEVFTRLRDVRERHFAWFEWSAPRGADLDSKESWAQANPSLYLKVNPERVAAERATSDDETFARERLGMWEGAASMAVIDPTTWARAADMMSQPTTRICLGIDVSVDLSAASVSIAGQRADERWHVETVENRNGVGWLVERVAGICERHSITAVVVDAASHAASLVDKFEAKGLRVVKTNARDMAAACGQFYVAVVEDNLRHIDLPNLNSALAGARKRPLGDAWAWNRKNSVADITPLVSATLALYGAQIHGQPPVPKSKSVFGF